MNIIDTRKRVIQQVMEMVRGGGVREAAAAWPMSPGDMRNANPGTLLNRMRAMPDADVEALASRIDAAYEEWAYAAAVLVGEARARERLIAARALIERAYSVTAAGTGSLVNVFDALERVVIDARGAAARGENEDIPAMLSELVQHIGAIGQRVDRSGRIRANASVLATSLRALSVVETV